MGGYRQMRGINIYKGPDNIEWETGTYLKYHKDWNWLMPVVDKLKECFKQTVEADSETTHTHNNGINFQLAIVNIQSTHLAVYHAILWYNQQKQTNG